MDNKDKFVGGMRVTRHEKAPDFVLASVGVNIGDFIAWADKFSKNGWVNFQLKKSKGGKLYAELDTWEKKPDASQGEVERPLETIQREETSGSCKDCTATEQCNSCAVPF